MGCPPVVWAPHRGRPPLQPRHHAGVTEPHAGGGLSRASIDTRAPPPLTASLCGTAPRHRGVCGVTGLHPAASVARLDGALLVVARTARFPTDTATPTPSAVFRPARRVLSGVPLAALGCSLARSAAFFPPPRLLPSPVIPTGVPPNPPFFLFFLFFSLRRAALLQWPWRRRTRQGSSATLVAWRSGWRPRWPLPPVAPCA